MTSSGSGAPSGGGSANKVGMLLLGAGLTIMVVVLVGPKLDGGGEDTPPTVVVTPSATPEPGGGGAATSSPAPPTPAPPPAKADRASLVQGYPSDSVVLTVTAYGMPARISATFDNASDVYAQGLYIAGSTGQRACTPDEQYPQPCLYYWVARGGATLQLTAGDSRAGFWPGLDSLRGPGCELGRAPADQRCAITLGADLDFEARYYGSQTPTGDYQFPRCPTGEARERAAAQSVWVARCR